MRVVIVDSHPTMQLGLKGLLLMTDVRVVGESGDGEEALRLVKRLRPDLVILSLNLTGEVDGLEACLRIKALPNPPRVLIHTAYSYTDDVSSSLLVGADSYVHERAGCEVLLDAIRRTAAGERVWLSGGEVGELHSRTPVVREGASLTPKEQKILEFILRSWSNTEIAEELHLGLSTVKTHVRNVLRKLNFKSRRELIRSSTLGHGIFR